MLRAYFDTTYPCMSFCLRVIIMFTLYAGMRLLLSSSNLPEWVLVTGVLICALYEVFVGGSQLIGGNSRHSLYALTGSFLNPGPYSAFLSVGLVMSCRLKKGCWLSFLFAVLLPATWSRAALVSAAVCMGVIYWDAFKRWWWQIMISFIILVIGLYLLKRGSADGRSIIYIISTLCIFDAPIFGAGIGSFCHKYAEKMDCFYQQFPSFNFHSADVIESAYNCVLQIGVEQGGIGICFAMTLVALLIIKLNKKGKILGLGLLCLLIFAMFSYPFDLLPYQIIFVVISAYAAADYRSIDTSKNKFQLLRAYFLSFAVLGNILMLSCFTYKKVKDRENAESDYKVMAGINHSAFINDYYELLPLLSDNKNFLFDFGKILASDGRYSDSNAILRMGTLISNDPMFYVLQGNNYSKMGFFQESELSYVKAFDIMPNRIYPLYCLMLLYEKNGKLEQVINMAHWVVDFKVKVGSPATKEMQEKAKDVIIQSRRLSLNHHINK